MMVIRYEYNLSYSMHNYSPNPSQTISEVEVFTGVLLGKTIGRQNKMIREHTKAMREDFNRHVTHTIESITRGELGDREEALARSIACLAIGVEEEGHVGHRVEGLQSWTYIAAAVCLRELKGASPYNTLNKM